MKTLRLLLLPFLMSLFSVIARPQSSGKKPLTHDVYDSWKSIKGITLSRDGLWTSYEINPQQGDGWLYFYNVKKQLPDSFPRGYNARFSPLSEYLVFKIKPQYQVIRKAKKEKKKKDELPKDSLGIVLLKDKSLMKIAKVKSFGVAEENSNWFWYRKEKVYPEKPDSAGKNFSGKAKEAYKKQKKEYDKKVKEINKTIGTDLVVMDPLKDKFLTWHDVTGQTISKNGKRIAFIVEKKDSMEYSTVYVFDTETEKERVILSREGKSVHSDKLTLSGKGDQVAFLYTADSGNAKIFDLFYWRKDQDSATVVVDTLTKGLLSGWSVSINRQPYFSEDGTRLFFGTAPKPEPEPKDTLPDDEKYHVDIWNWKDPYLQPMQKLQAEREKKRTWLALWYPGDKKIVQLGNKKVPEVSVALKGNAPWALGRSNLPYRKLISWEANRYQNIYRINLKTGEKEKLLTKAPSAVSLSPEGNYLVWYQTADSCWYAWDLNTGKEVNLTGSLPVAFYNERHDTPSDPYPYGLGAWYDNDRYFILYDMFDIWKMDPSGKEEPACLTKGYGRKNHLQFRRQLLDRKKKTISPSEKLFLHAFNMDSKQSGYFTVSAGKQAVPVKLVLDDYQFSSLIKPEKANDLFWRKESFVAYPELWTGDIHMHKARKISVTNPQQKDYLWGTVELVNWRAFDGEKHQGLLYKPENFDPSKKYPMIVYFYERSSDGMHRHWVPAPSRSIINRTMYTSNGYLIFVPDITYQVGYPGQSAYKAVVSGTQAMVERYPFIDRNRLAMNGQSWGGYQIAYLVTQTDMFRCAFSGAPVSNMTSAYGGIRWGSGMSRMFQYEQTQSRIGGTLWDKPLLYIENSPIFFVPKIHTPLLIMHNDKDGAVPWYQGIEFFVALRRLNKPAWLLEYNNEDHNLFRRADEKDLSVRVMQFYDHYLKEKPAPVWMVKGIPAVEKGKTDGYELMPEK